MVRRKVLVYRSRLLPYSETFIHEQVRCLENWLAVLVGNAEVEGGLDLSGMNVRLIAPRSRLLRKLERCTRLCFGRSPRSAIRSLPGERAELLHAHFGPDAIEAWPLARDLCLPLLVTLHGYDINIHASWWRSGKGGALMRSYPDRLLRLSQQDGVAFLAVSEALRERAIEFGIPPTKIRTGYLGVDVTRFFPRGKLPSERIEVLFVGRLVQKKGCEYLIEAFSRVQPRFPWAQLTIVGEGPLRSKLEILALQKRVRARFLGAQPRSTVMQLMEKARVLCLPSVTADSGDQEGLPIVVLEAQASGVPVITSSLGGATEGIVHGASGFAHREGDVCAISEYLEQLLADGDLANRFAKRARTHAEQSFDIRKCIRQLEREYQRLSTANSSSGSHNDDESGE